MLTRRRWRRERQPSRKSFSLFASACRCTGPFRLAVPVHDDFAGHGKIEYLQPAGFHCRKDLYLR